MAEREKSMSDFEKLINASDLIEWIMETYPDWCVGDVRSIVDHVGTMRPAQSEIIRCKDCKHGEPWTYMHKKEYVTCKVDCEEIDRDSDFFCADGERKDNEDCN